MKTGNIILIPFPFAELTNFKVRPALVVAKTSDKYQDIIVCAISSVVPNELSGNDIEIVPDNVNGLRVRSVIKVDRIVTVKKEQVITSIGHLQKKHLLIFKEAFKKLVD